MAAAEPLNTLTFPLSDTRLIEASAGTGKTYTIAALYVRLILGHGTDNDLPTRELLPPDILVVTFTDAATKELRERIRARLTQTARFFRQQPVKSDPFLEQLRAHYTDADKWGALAHRLELAANWMDESAVYTIHGWCNRMLQQHAFDSGSLFRQEVNTNDAELLNEVVRDYWRTFYYQLSHNDPDFEAIYSVFKQPDALLKEIKSLLRNSDPIGEWVSKDQSIKELITAINKSKQEQLKRLKQPWAQWAPEIQAILDTAVNDQVLPARNYNVNHRNNWIIKITEWSLDPLQEKLDIGKGFINLSPNGMAELVNPRQTPPEHPGFEAISQLPQQLAALPSLKVELIKHAIHWIRNRYDTEKQRLAQMTFDDMLTRLDKALLSENGEQLANVIRQQYPVALIDEFQDTDPVQYRIFERLYAKSPTTDLACFMIGDPKQAIYSFRGADIYTYLKAHKTTAGRHYTLATNYRSTTELVSAVNQVFSQADLQDEGAFRFKDGSENPLPFIPVKAAGRKETWVIDGHPATALTLWHSAAPEPIGLPAYRKEMAEVTASEIVRLLNLANEGKTGFKSESGTIQALQPADIAILVRTGKEAKAMRNALASRRLRSVYLSERDSIYQTGTAGDVLIWLKAMAEPRDERKVRAALSTATLAWPYQALHQLTLDEPSWEQQLERFISYQQRWQDDGILPTLRQLINDYTLHGQLQLDHEGERCLTNLLHLAELLQQASSQLEGEQALIRYLAEAISDASNQSDENVLRLESDANLIKIITIHKSKGLEYPLVFLPFICSFREVGSLNTYYRYHDDKQHLVIDLSKDEAIKALSDGERHQEDLRLLYVAMTRAQHACWLGIAPVKVGNTANCQLEKSAMGYVLGWQANTPASELVPHLTALKGECAAITLAVLPAPTFNNYSPAQQQETPDSAQLSTVKIADNWWIASYSALHTEDKQVIQGEPSLTPETAQDDKQSDEADIYVRSLTTKLSGIHSLARGAGPGVLIHELLEQCAYQGFNAVQASEILPRQLITRIFNHESWQDKHDIIAQALAHWLSMPLLEGETVGLADLGVNQFQAELEFLIGADKVDVIKLDQLVTQHTFAGCARPRLLPAQLNGLLKGFIDLVFVHKQQYYVADYKFNGLGNNNAAYTEAAMETAMLSKRYDLQGVLYLLALHRLLKARLGDNYDYDTHVGGGLYLFLRGSQSASNGRVLIKAPKVLIESIDSLFTQPRLQGESA